MSKTIAVIGATGIQGGSVISTLLQEGTYHIRGITRNTQSAQAQLLSSRGVEMVTADLNDEASLIVAFSGVHAIYAVTDFFEPFSKHGPTAALSIEVKQGKALANAAAATPTLEHYIWSTLPNGSLLSSGKYVIPHFEGKNVVDAHIKQMPALLAKTTFLWNSYYASNLLFPLFTPNFVKSAGKYVRLQPTPPSTKITILGDPSVNVGPFVSAILRRPELTLPGKFVLASTEEMSQGEILRRGVERQERRVCILRFRWGDYDRLWPMWGKEIGSMLKMWEELGERSWVVRRLLRRRIWGSRSHWSGLRRGSGRLIGVFFEAETAKPSQP